MARYQVLTRTYLNERLFETGEEIDYEGVPNAALKPLDKDGEAAVAARKDEIEKGRAAAKQSAVPPKMPSAGKPQEPPTPMPEPAKAPSKRRRTKK